MNVSGSDTGFLSKEILDPIQTGSHADHQHVKDGQGRHTFDYDHGARHDDGIVAAFDGDGDVLSGFVHGLLRSADGGGGLEGGPEDQVASVADAPEDASCVIGPLGDGSCFFHIESVVVFASAGTGGRKAVSDLEAFDGADGADSLGQVGV